MPTPEARTRTAASGEAPAILVADRSKANDPVTRSIPAPVNSVAGRSTVLPMAYGANAKKYNELNEPSFDKKGFGRSSSDTVHRS
ncbi:hypothetical protein LSH36_932g01072 [Paralvinella palmiformis]|uniref:Uncharacterized protein n=1 Tax=Paralvinella palmiformis TaxID=53620 RepID=A0AAD9IXZ1_9ANNE|nr:hypothetical protein LSH36_932g01072 [Paralvinella palmiformis]